MACSAVTLSVATIAAVLSLACLSISFGTDNWLETRVNRTAIRQQLQRDTDDYRLYETRPEYFSRDQGLFRICFPEKKPKGCKSIRSLMPACEGSVQPCFFCFLYCVSAFMPKWWAGAPRPTDEACVMAAAEGRSSCLARSLSGRSPFGGCLSVCGHFCDEASFAVTFRSQVRVRWAPDATLCFGSTLSTTRGSDRVWVKMRRAEAAGTTSDRLNFTFWMSLTRWLLCEGTVVIAIAASKVC